MTARGQPDQWISPARTESLTRAPSNREGQPMQAGFFTGARHGASAATRGELFDVDVGLVVGIVCTDEDHQSVACTAEVDGMPRNESRRWIEVSPEYFEANAMT